MKQKIQSSITDGISQSDRFPASLHPDFFQVEERTNNDFLQYLLTLSKHFNFYDLNSQVDGDWEDFFLSDINVVVKIISKSDINTFIRRYDQLKSQLIRESSDAALTHDLRELFQFIYEFILFQVKLHNKFSIIPKSELGINEFRRIIHEYDRYDEELKALNSWLAFAKKHFGETLHINFDERESVYVAQYGTNDDEIDFFNLVENKKDKILSGFKYFDALFARLRTKYYRLQEAADIFLHKRNTEGPQYSPHMGLLVTFLELYKLLKKDINQLNKKHLDFYFHDILKLDYKKAIPDKLYLQVEINPAFQKVIIDKGEALLIDKPDFIENNLFVIDEDAVLTKAKIKELLSVYVSETIKLTSKNDDDSNIIELQLFTSVNPVNQPANFIGLNPKLRSWPLLGEDQEDISRELMTMQASDIGLVIASPLLFAKDGKRNFHIKLYLSESSFAVFRQYAFDYAAVADSHPRIVMHSMLKEAFFLDITGNEDWIHINKYNINCDIDNGADQCIDIHFELNASEPGTAGYDRVIHGGEYDTELPMIRLKLNNSAFYNPYTFFKGLNLQRITIRLSVTESKQVKLRNNIGEVSIVNPFPLFGPQPAIGSYLDIKNTNIFNRYTRDFSVKLHWFDLPKQKGGFETYYKGYPDHIKNESFKVSLSGLNEGRYYPEGAEQQVYDLFVKRNEAGAKSLLSNTTVLDNVDFLKIHFDNTLSLAKEEDSEANFKEGAIKIELASPPDAFGHRVFNSLFPEVVMHNGRRFVTKWSIPNPAYVPVLKAITVDYVLEHSESLSAVYRDKVANDGMFIWHDHPFGYKKVYPGKNTGEFTLIPEFAHQSNLLIGLEEAIPGELISLLFQFEENNFNQYNYYPEDIQWSILQDNDWINIPKADVLLDETANFIKTGIVTIRLPELPGNRNTILNPSLYWIKASCNCRGNIRSKTIAVFAQVVSATRQLTDESILSADDLFLAPGTLTQFKRKNPQVMNVFQPFASFNGKTRETEQQYYIRVSEQLRHKNRAITAMDISQLVLEAFPEILKVKCFDTEVNGQTILPGIDLLVVVILNQQNKQKELQEYPKVDLSKLFTIKQFLVSLLSPFTTVEVVNPVYEKIKVVCSIVFNSETGVSAARQTRSKESNGILLQKLNTDIKQWLSPWLYNPGSNLNTEGKVYLSEILNFIKRCPYVSYATGFSVLHYYQVYDVRTGEFYDRVIDSANEKTEYLKASLPHALLVSSPEHAITVLDKPHYVEQHRTGIGGMAVGSELLIADVNEYSALTDVETTEQEDNKQYNFYFNPNNP
ncbi:MAG: hypothetical protein V4557_10660 [Bacteroidota bacterium]